ncbi:MAG: hypothetical protein ABIU63_15075 [Chitinophagaceae bacterium]
MFNPFALFEPKFLEGFKMKRVKVMVMQTFDRGCRDARPAYLLTHFFSLGDAQQHYDVLQHDPNRERFFIDNEADFNKLKARLEDQPQALYYMCLLVRDADKLAKKQLDTAIMVYIANHTSWRPARSEEVHLDLKFKFGEIFVHLFYGKNQVREKLDIVDHVLRHQL